MNIQSNYDQWAASYDSDENKTRDLDKRVSQQTLRNYDFKTVLEIGCGTGKNTNWLRAHCSYLLAVDFSEEMLAIAKEKIKDPRVRFHQANITQAWEFTKGLFDLITCNLILEHIEDVDFVFQQSAYKLHKKGLFFISEYHPFKQYLGKQARFEKNGETVLIPSYTHHVSEFIAAGKKNDFELVELKEWMNEHEDEDKIPRILSLVFRII